MADSGPFLDDLFEELVALSGAARERRLAAVASRSASLASELRAMLSVDGGPGVEDVHPAPLAEGDELDRYRLSRRLGVGASAGVWQAWDTHLRTWTALKVLHPRGPVGRSALDAVLHEARAASQIISDHVVRVREAGRLPSGVCFIEMQLCAEHRPREDGQEELVVGTSLAGVGVVGPDEAARLVAEAARGVDAAHRAGVLHRDLKPANLLLLPVSRRVLVTDFGLSAAGLAPEPSATTPATASVSVVGDGPVGAIVGTPAWMSPEQARGRAPSRASDIYALGATLYTLLAGRAPYDDGDRRRHAREVIESVRVGPPVPLRGPARLVRIVARAMARDPEDRYATAGALARDLERWRGSLPVSVDGARPLLRAALLARRNRAITAAVVVLGTVLALFGASVHALEVRRVALVDAVADAEQRRVEAEALAARADAVRIDAEASRIAAEQARHLADLERGVAESERIAAEAERAAAEADRAAALVAREAAQDGQTAAERLAAEQIRARQDAERRRALGEAAQGEAERRVRDMLVERAQLEGRVATAEEMFRREQTARRALERLLEQERSARRLLESTLAAERAAVRVAPPPAAPASGPTTTPAPEDGAAGSPEGLPGEG